MEAPILNREFSEAEVKSSYSKVAWFYDFWSWMTESRAAGRVIGLSSIANGESILEVAVGTGVVFRKIVSRNPGGLTEGIDLSGSMLLRAEKKLRNYDQKSYQLQTGNAYDLPFDDNKFDLLVNNFMIDLLPEEDFLKVLSEFYRVLKPGGRAVVSTMAYGTKWHNKFWHWLARKFPGLLTGCRPVSIKNYLQGSGFIDIDAEQISQNTFPSEVLIGRKAPSA